MNPRLTAISGRLKGNVFTKDVIESWLIELKSWGEHHVV